MSNIEKLEHALDDYLHGDTWERTGGIGLFMKHTIDIFKSQQAQIADLTKRINDLEQKGSYFKRAENIKEVRRLISNI